MNKYAQHIINSETCNACPRRCDVNRKSKLGFCGAPEKIWIAKIMVHNWEEPYLTNCSNNNKQQRHGSGAIFFSQCNLKCVYCQNNEISNHLCGKQLTPKQLANIFKKLEKQNVCNINLVTPTHYVKQIIQALEIYKPKIPIIYNTSGYENKETILALKKYIDIFLFDFKYFSNQTSLLYSYAKNYPEKCKIAIKTAKKIIKSDIFDKNGIMQKGIVIRHLLLPGKVNEAINLCNYIYNNIGHNTYLSLLNQYIPMHKANLFPEINRKVKPIEYKVVVNYLKTLDMPNVYLQDELSSSSQYIPDFNVFCEF